MALTPCTVPQAGKPTFDLGPDEMEMGMGIHGEPGIRTCTDALIVAAMKVGVTHDRLAGNGRLLLRYSGTEELARVMVEGMDASLVEATAADLAAAIRESLGA